VQVTPLAQLGERVLHGLEVGALRVGVQLEQHLVRPQVQAELPLRRGEDVHDRAIQRVPVGANVPKQE
jgi:hypothetical protein